MQPSNPLFITKNIVACSFLPAATKMIYNMGLQDHLQGVTFECIAGPLDNKPAAGGMVEGIEMLAALFHPQLFKIPTHL